MTTPTQEELFELWRSHHTAPHHFPMDLETWCNSMYADIDNDGRKLFVNLMTDVTWDDDGNLTGFIQYGSTAFGFDESGEISAQIHYPVIRTLSFQPNRPEDGENLLRRAMHYFGEESGRIYAFFHYFGMTACARHGKLHEDQNHIESLLLRNGFEVEHENVYYARELTAKDSPTNPVDLRWDEETAGGCRGFAASVDGQEVGWGQVHFLPQKDIAYLRWIYIDEKCQHQGLGTRIMQTLFRDLFQSGIRRFDTDTALNNTAAQGYYEKTGFSHKGITRSYYTT